MGAKRKMKDETLSKEALAAFAVRKPTTEAQLTRHIADALTHSTVEYGCAAPANAPKSWALKRDGTIPAAVLGLAMVLSPSAGSVAQAQDGAAAAHTLPSADSLNALAGRRVQVEFADGTIVLGELLSATNEEIMLAQEPNGRVVEFPSSELARVLVLAPAFDETQLRPVIVADGPERRSTGMMVAGIVMTSVGIANLMSFGTWTMLSSGYVYYSWPFAVTGGVLLAAGIPMWVVGAAEVEVAPAAYSDGGEIFSGGRIGFSF